MAMEHSSLASLAAVADATMAPTSPHGSEADWDWVDESAAKENEIQRQSDDLRVQEMGATQQLMPLNQAHPGGMDDASLQKMADLAACVERLQIARDAVEQLSPVSSTTGSVLTRLGLEPTQRAVDDVAGASQPMETEAALTAASSAEGEVDVPMDGTKDHSPPRTKVPPLPGFLAAKAQKIYTDAIRFKIDKTDPNRVKFVMFPDSFPSVPGNFPALLQGTSESELLDLFSSWVDVPLTEPGVTRVIEAYIPMKLARDLEDPVSTRAQGEWSGILHPQGTSHG